MDGTSQIKSKNFEKKGVAFVLLVIPLIQYCASSNDYFDAFPEQEGDFDIEFSVEFDEQVIDNPFESNEDISFELQEPFINDTDGESVELFEDSTSDESELPPIRDDAIGPWPWYQQAHYAINWYSLQDFFTREGYQPPSNSEILVGKVVQGVGQPAYLLYDINRSSFSFDFWPASTVKVLACLGALDFLSTFNMTGNATVTMYYDDGTVYTDQVRQIYTRAISVSSNPDYDRCVEIAGFDRLNEIFLVPERDLPETVIQRRYGYRGSLRVSPAMDFVEGSRTWSVARREGVGDFGCPPEGNCANLFELLNSIRRVVLYDEIPDIEKFNLVPEDVSGLKEAMRSATSYFQQGAEAVFGAGVIIYNKTGYVPGDDILDHGVIVDPSTGDRYLVAVSVPETLYTRQDLSDFAQHALMAVYSFDEETAMPWQRDAGISIRVQLDDGGVIEGKRRIQFTIDASGADRIRLWTDTWYLGETAGGPRFSFTYDYQRGGERLLVLKAWSGTTAIGYRAMAVSIPPP